MLWDDGEIGDPGAFTFDFVGGHPAYGLTFMDGGIESDGGVIGCEMFGGDLGAAPIGEADEFGFFGGVDAFDEGVLC